MKTIPYFSAFLLVLAIGLDYIHASDENLLNMEAFGNLSYQGIYDEPITLQDGVYEGAPFVTDSAARPHVQIAKTLYTLSDLDQDGKQDAAVLLIERSGGTGEISYLAVVSQRDGVLQNIATRRIGDRIQIRSLASEKGKLLLDFVAAGPGEPLCCPTQKLRNTYRLESDELIEDASDRLGQVSAADLEGVLWKLTRLSHNEAVPEDLKITAVFELNKVSGSAGCNRYFADLKDDNPQDLSISPAGTTRMACPLSIMKIENGYLSALQKVIRFSFILGELALSYKDGDKFNTMLFVQEQ